MLHCQELGNVADKDAYGAWNMGQGMVIMSRSPSEVMEVAAQHGIAAKIIGEVVSKPTITIHGSGLNHDVIEY